MSIFGGRIPNEVKMMAKAVTKTDYSDFQTVLQLVVGSLEGKKVAADAMEVAFRHIPDDEKECISAVTAGLLTILKAILRLPESKLKAELMKEELEELNYKRMSQAAISRCPRLPSLKEFSWRMDVSIATSCISRVFEPTIVVTMARTDGSVKTFEMSMKRFHQLRCSVAVILKEMEDLEARHAIKMLESN